MNVYFSSRCSPDSLIVEGINPLDVRLEKRFPGYLKALKKTAGNTTGVSLTKREERLRALGLVVAGLESRDWTLSRVRTEESYNTGETPIYALVAVNVLKKLAEIEPAYQVYANGIPKYRAYDKALACLSADPRQMEESLVKNLCSTLDQSIAKASLTTPKSKKSHVSVSKQTDADLKQFSALKEATAPQRAGSKSKSVR